MEQEGMQSGPNKEAGMKKGAGRGAPGSDAEGAETSGS